MIDLSCVILTYNRWEKTKKLLDSLYSYIDTNITFEIIIIDNGSTDLTLENLRQYNSIKLIENRSNERLEGDNKGFKEAQGQYILRLDNDVEFTEHFMTSFLEAINTEGVGLVVPATSSGGKHQKTDSKFGLCLDKYKVGSSVWFFRKSLLEEIGNIDPRFAYYCNDMDFQLRVLQRGYKIAIAGQVLVKHDNQSSLALPENEIEVNKAKKILYEKWGSLLIDLYGKPNYFEDGYETFTEKILNKLK